MAEIDVFKQTVAELQARDDELRELHSEIRRLDATVHSLYTTMAETCCVVLADPFFKQLKDAVVNARAALEGYLIQDRKEYDEHEEAKRHIREGRAWWKQILCRIFWVWDPSVSEEYRDPKDQVGLYYPTLYQTMSDCAEKWEHLAAVLLALPTTEHTKIPYVRVPYTLYREAVGLGLIKADTLK